MSWGAKAYQAEITAFKAGYDIAIEVINVIIEPLTSRLTTNTSTIAVNWRETFDIYVKYEYNNSGVWTGITGASVKYRESNYLVGPISLTDLGLGWYGLSINTTEFPLPGTYDIEVVATCQNYETLKLSDYIPSREIVVSINEIATKINDTYYYGS